MTFSRQNSSISPSSPKFGSNVFLSFEARGAKSGGAGSGGAFGSVREVSFRPREKLGAASRPAEFPADASSRSRETHAVAAASLERQLRTLSSSSFIVRFSCL